jgi:inorganic pyrophosphatase
MSIFPKHLVLPSSARRPKPAPIAEQNLPEVRQRLRNQALNLRQHANFEAVVRPHIDRLVKEIKDLKQLCAEHEAKIQEMEKEIESSDRIDDEADVRQQKINEIIHLEEVYRQLLAEKEAYIARAAGENFV